VYAARPGELSSSKRDTADNQDYSASQSFPHASSTLDELEHYGFIYKRDTRPDGSKSDQFFPTHLATSLTSGAATTLESGDDKKFLILETNYKIYAYTCKLRTTARWIQANK
jgi:transcription initiation factor TFIIH subunit 4